ncbi:MAG: hypothetical protein OET90_07455, partial [Desulfuromonadales bacterium]|nr:hypothetical protein [Desulfuromonadales bacterium]
FTVADKPLSLSVDPHNHLFRQLYPEELPATVNHLRASKSPLVVVATGAEALLEASNDLLRGLQWHQAEVVSEAEYLKTTPETVDLLIIGQPQHQGLLPDLPHSDAIVDRLPSAADEVVFWVRKQDSSKQVIAAFLPGSVAAARDTARRIPHYGRYSYLLFEKGRNLHKSTWDTVASPLIETF